MAKLPFIIDLTDLNSYSPEESLANFFVEQNFPSPAAIDLDGKIHRFGKNNNCWYIGYEGDYPCAIVGDWATGEQHKWFYVDMKELSIGEQEKYKARIEKIAKEREEIRKEESRKAAIEAEQIYSKGIDIEKHEYLTTKNIKAINIKQVGGALAIPIIDQNNNISSLQYIYPNGDKRFLTGGTLKGCFYMLRGTAKAIYLCEGYATAVSIHTSTNATVFISFTANNLPNVSKYLNTLELSHTIVADNDKSGTGEKYAKLCNNPYILIPNVGMDANDYVNAGFDLKELLQPKKWLVNANDFSQAPAPVNWLIKNYLPKNSLIMLHGPSGCGKTFLLLDWLLHISVCYYWFGNKTKKGNVIYLCGEGNYGLRSRIAAWKKQNNVDDIENFAISTRAEDLDTTVGFNFIINELRKLPFTPDVIAIDTLNRFFSGDENSAQESRLFINNCSKLTEEFGCSVIIVHHTGIQDTSRARGSTAWKGSLDMEFGVTKNKDEKSFTLKCLKSKDTKEPMDKVLALKGIDLNWKDEDGEAVTSAIVVASKDESIDMKKEVLIQADVQQLQEAFLEVGRFECGKCLIERKDWSDYRISEGAKKESIRQYFNKPNQPIQRLIREKIIKEIDGVYEVIAQEEKLTLSALLKIKKEKEMEYGEA